MNLFARFLLRKILSKPAPERIPRSGRRSEGVDCFVVYVGPEDKSWSFLIQSISSNGYSGRYWEGPDSSVEACMTFEMAKTLDWEITHFYGRYEMNYASLIQYFWQGVLPIDKLKIKVGSIEQFLFNKKVLPLPDRIEVLKVLLERTLDSFDQDRQVSSVSLMTYMHSQKWVQHPDKDKQLRYNNLLLDSLVSSGDVMRGTYGYEITPKALVTISLYEEEKRRHDQTLSQSKNIKWLTLGLIVVGFVQSFVTYYVSSKFGS